MKKYLEKLYSQIQKSILQKKDSIFNIDTTDIIAAIGDNDLYNSEELQQLEFVYKQYYHGGALIIFPGDITLLEITNIPTDDVVFVLNSANNFLLSKGINSEIQGNDLMIGDFKVGSYSQAKLQNGMWESGVHISMSVDNDLINKICTKETNKIPKGLLDFGINKEELKNYIINELPNRKTNSQSL